MTDNATITRHSNQLRVLQYNVAKSRQITDSILNDKTTSQYTALLLQEQYWSPSPSILPNGKFHVNLIDNTYRFVCRFNPKRGKKFIRVDCRNRHEERHQNKKQREDTNSNSFAKLAPAPFPKAVLFSSDPVQTLATTIPSSSPEYEDRNSTT